MGLVRTYTAEAYARMLKALLPPGRWRLDPDSNLSKILLACGDELARISQRARDLVREADPTQTDELLPEWERMLGLSSEGTKEERRGRIVARLVRRQRFRPADFKQALAQILGLAPEDVEVIETKRANATAMDDDRAIYRFFVYRDPGLPGDYDIDDAQDMIDRMKPTHTAGHAIESVNFLTDDEHSLTDRDILGA